jgi:hypothetical protein
MDLFSLLKFPYLRDNRSASGGLRKPTRETGQSDS